MRLFIAIPVPALIKREIVTMQNVLSGFASYNRVPDDNLHVTMSFLGEEPDYVSAVNALTTGARDIRPFTLALDSFDVFNDTTAVTTLKGDVYELEALNESLQSSLSSFGMRIQSRRFMPHITIGRKLECTKEALEKLKLTKIEGSFFVNAVHLYESRRVGDRMVYTSLHKHKLC